MQTEPYSRAAADTATESLAAARFALDPDPADVLDQAAAVIEANGLHKDAWWYRVGYADRPVEWTPGTPCCATTAIAVAMGRRQIREVQHILHGEHPALMALVDRLALHQPSEILSWNDHPSRTAGQVVTAMRDAAVALRARAT
jgi:hypothetical protein